jgi:hypothetical protein
LEDIGADWSAAQQRSGFQALKLATQALYRTASKCLKSSPSTVLPSASDDQRDALQIAKNSEKRSDFIPGNPSDFFCGSYL